MLADGAIIRIGETTIQFTDKADTTGIKGRTQVLLSELLPAAAPEATITGAGSNSQANLLSTISSSHQTLIGNIAIPSLAPQEDTLAIISRVSVTLLSPLSLDDTMQQVLECVFDTLPAERGYLMLPDNGSNTPPTLVCKASKRGVRKIPKKFKSVAPFSEHVLQQGASVLTSDAQQDPRFQDNGSIMLGGVRSVMAVPLAVEGRVWGMIYIDSPFQTNRFTERDLSLLTLIASVAAIRIEKCGCLICSKNKNGWPTNFRLLLKFNCGCIRLNRRRFPAMI